jgi:HSP20 family protein
MTPYGHEGLGDVFFDRLWPEWRRDMGEEWCPSVNFYEKEGKYHLTAEIPGLNKDDISISFDNGCVTISGKKESESDEEGVDFYRRETSHGSFSRSFNLPKSVDEDKVDASYKDGVLTLVMPHKEGSDRKRIEIH